jgi:hypothetical protein
MVKQVDIIKSMRHFMSKTLVQDLDKSQDNSSESSESPALRNLDFFQSIQALTQDKPITTISNIIINPHLDPITE